MADYLVNTPQLDDKYTFINWLPRSSNLRLPQKGMFQDSGECCAVELTVTNYSYLIKSI